MIILFLYLSIGILKLFLLNLLDIPFQPFTIILLIFLLIILLKKSQLTFLRQWHSSILQLFEILRKTRLFTIIFNLMPSPKHNQNLTGQQHKSCPYLLNLSIFLLLINIQEVVRTPTYLLTLFIVLSRR